MDRYEYKLKLDQIRTCLEDKNYREAADLADTINWKKVKTVSSLCLAGEVYEKAERYEEARDAYLMAYDRSPIGRSIVFRLTMVAVKAGNCDEAAEYYDEFIEIAPNDNLRFILRYQISKARGAGVAELISILEEYKEEESSERWSFELATLYHKAGMGEKCVEACDELILWFGDGKYVEKALELKMLYQPLTRSQEEVYRKIRQNHEGVVEVTPYDELQSGEIVREAVKIPPVVTSPVSFNTMNLQNELAENMKQIMEATQKEDVSSHMANIKNLVKNIPYLKIPEKEESESQKHVHIETDAEIDGSLRIDFKEVLAEDSDGQISLNMPDLALEQQITGQMSIGDVLAEWEKTKRAAQAALEEAERRKLESAKARALQEAEGIMDRLQDVIPQLDAGMTPKDLMENYLANTQPMEWTEAEKKTLESVEDLIEEPEKTEEKTIIEKEDVVQCMEQKLESSLLEETDSVLELSGIDESQPTKDLSELAEQFESQEEDQVPIKFLTEEQKEIFSYFVKVPGMEKQLCQAMSGIKSRANEQNSVAGNVIITGGRGSGKTVLATNLVRALKKVRKDASTKVGKISSASLNKKGVLSTIDRMAGGYLIIEKAGDLNHETAAGLSLALEGATGGLVVMIEDTRAGIEKLLKEFPELGRKFTERISIPIFTNDELVQFARSYANELEYEIEEMAVLALYNRINGIQKLDRATTLTEVKEIVDEAIERAEKGGLKSIFTSVFTKRYNENDYLILKEKDFEK